MDKAAIYCRLSDEDRNKMSAVDDSESIQNQKELLVKYAVEKGWSIYKIYSDDDYSGLDKDRPEFNKMLQDAKAGRFNIVLCKHQSRFTRDMELVEKYIHSEFINWGVRFVSVTDNADTWDKGNKKSRQINGLVNEWYSEDISEAIKATFKIKRESGRFIGSFASYGYIKDPGDKNRLIVDEHAADVVRNIFNWYLEGYGTQRIAQILNEKEIPNPTEYKKACGLNFRNSSSSCGYGLWNKTTVKRILKNEVYIGNMVQGKRKKVSYKSKKVVSAPSYEWSRVINAHPPIISRKTFDEVQQRIKNKVRSTTEGTVHIFASKVRCMDCGSTMNKVSNKNYTYLRCSYHAMGPGRELCTSHSIRLDHLTDIITERIRYYINTSSIHEQIYKLAGGENHDSFIRPLKAEANMTIKHMKVLTEAIQSLYVDKVKGLIAEEQFNELNNRFLSERKLQSDKLAALESSANDMSEKHADTDRSANILEKYKSLNRLTPIMVNSLISHIEIGEKSRDTGEQKIRIHWLF